MTSLNGGGMKRIFRGILQYRKTVKAGLVEQFKRIRDNPQPTAVFFTCMDSRMLATRFTQAQVGDMFMVRNAGNIVPHATSYGNFGAEVSATTEPAAIELGCVRGGIRHVVVCGHSDCKAMNTLYEMHTCNAQLNTASPLEMWLRRNGFASIEKLEKRLKNGSSPIEYLSELPHYKFSAIIDPEDVLSPADKLSQINCLQSLENIASHPVIREHIEQGELQLHGMWFDIYTGEVYYFSRKSKQFVLLDENSIDQLLKELGDGPVSKL